LRINEDPDLISYPYANPTTCSQITLRLSFTPLLITHPCLVCMGVFRIPQPNLILRVAHFNLLAPARLVATRWRLERATSALQLTIVTFLNGSETFDSLGRFDIDLISSSSYSLDFGPPLSATIQPSFHSACNNPNNLSQEEDPHILNLFCFVLFLRPIHTNSTTSSSKSQTSFHLAHTNMSASLTVMSLIILYHFAVEIECTCQIYSTYIP